MAALGSPLRVDQHVAPGHVDLVGQGHSDRRAGPGPVEIAVDGRGRRHVIWGQAWSSIGPGGRW